MCELSASWVEYGVLKFWIEVCEKWNKIRWVQPIYGLMFVSKRTVCVQTCQGNEMEARIRRNHLCGLVGKSKGQTAARDKKMTYLTNESKSPNNQRYHE